MTTHIDSFIRQVAMSRQTFGPSERTAGVIDHIRSELEEIGREATSFDRALEWVDVVILARDGLWRALSANDPSATTRELAEEAVRLIEAKQDRNDFRDWPDYRTADPNASIEHVRTPEEEVAKLPLTAYERGEGVASTILALMAETGASAQDALQALRIQKFDFASTVSVLKRAAEIAHDRERTEAIDHVLATTGEGPVDAAPPRTVQASPLLAAPYGGAQGHKDGDPWTLGDAPPPGFMAVHDTQRGYVLKAVEPAVMFQHRG